MLADELRGLVVGLRVRALRLRWRRLFGDRAEHLQRVLAEQQRDDHDQQDAADAQAAEAAHAHATPRRSSTLVLRRPACHFMVGSCELGSRPFWLKQSEPRVTGTAAGGRALDKRGHRINS
jgi:hypothetical protein